MGTLTVLGHARVDVPPDEASLSIAVESVQETPEAALADVAERAQAVVGVLDEVGVELAQRVTAGVSVREEREHTRDGDVQRRGFRASERFSVATSDVAAVGKIFALAVDRAGALVEGPWWSVALDNPVRRDALAAAAADARSRGEALALGLGARLGEVIDAVEGGAQGPEPRGIVRMAAADLPIEAGNATVTVSVSVTFELLSP